MNRLKQKFYGVLTDEELYLIEDALNDWGDDNKAIKEKCDKLMQKLYSEFYELPPKTKLGLYLK